MHRVSFSSAYICTPIASCVWRDRSSLCHSTTPMPVITIVGYMCYGIKAMWPYLPSCTHMWYDINAARDVAYMAHVLCCCPCGRGDGVSSDVIVHHMWRITGWICAARVLVFLMISYSFTVHICVTWLAEVHKFTKIHILALITLKALLGETLY